MNDPEFRQMLNKAIFILAVVIVFAVPVYFIYKNKISVEDSKILKKIKQEKTFFIYVTEDKCKTCKELKKELNNEKVLYEELNKGKERDYDRIITKLELNNSILTVPTLIYVEEGKVVSYIVDIKSEEYLKEYINNYK